MSGRLRDRVIDALVVLLVQLILVVASLSVCFFEDTPEGFEVAVVRSAQGVPEPF